MIDQIFKSIDHLIDGRLVCGAGGGGFLQVVLKRGVQKEEVQERLKAVFQDSLVGVWDCELVWYRSLRKIKDTRRKDMKTTLLIMAAGIGSGFGRRYQTAGTCGNAR